MEIQTKRVYDEPAASDGFRVLVDRLWPRGLSKEKADIDLWAKDIAPSAELRKAFHHGGMPFDEFVKAYRAELRGNAAEVAKLRDEIAGRDVVTLLYAMNDTEHNHAGLVRDALAPA
ncbi:DUF488 family protein [Microbacterium protaetiae]|uniref:DUF488 family protein n=1 Tax=Microbacterium protaetiae TaxID=2509458 RepID=A0A4P6EGC9_9MICO|nr:DUF488 family protein [Microbacterium protaetiae]QAY59207.1 DUF488 family protein [Microbacterium protaetiae]